MGSSSGGGGGIGGFVDMSGLRSYASEYHHNQNHPLSQHERQELDNFLNGYKVEFPIVADPNRELIQQLNMVDPDEKDSQGNQVPSRALHIVGPDKKITMSFLYPASVGRNMDEVVRVLDALQKSAKHKVATPANWKPGDPVVIAPNVSNEEAKQMFPQGYKSTHLPSNKDYLRFTHV